MKHLLLVGTLLLMLSWLGGCDEAPKLPSEPEASPPVESGEVESTASEAAVSTEAPNPPVPPMFETFDASPVLSLFPRAGAFRPEEGEELSYWATFIDHIRRTSGVSSLEERGRVWGVRSIRGIDSIGFFSPLAVTPETTYRVSFDMWGKLPKGASAGIGVIEFDTFDWIAEQMPESYMREHQTGVVEGVRKTGDVSWGGQSFTFTTTSRAGMIHLVLYREGAADRGNPIFFDNIRIEAIAEEAPGNDPQ